MTVKRISPAVLHPLKEALTLAFWYKPDLRAFLTSSLQTRELVSQLDWTDYKRSIVAQLVDSLYASQHRYFDELLNLILATADITDPSHLKKVENGAAKYTAAVEALDSLRAVVDPYRRMRSEEEEAERRRARDKAKAETQRAINEKLEELRTLFYEIHQLDPQPRGYALEKFLNGLFALYDIEAKAPFKKGASKSMEHSLLKENIFLRRNGEKIYLLLQSSIPLRARLDGNSTTLWGCSCL